MKIRALTIVFLFIFLIPATAAGSGIREFLASTGSDYTLLHMQDKMLFLSNTTGNNPYINEVLLGTETDRFQLDKEKYSLRVKPNGWGENAAGKMLSSAMTRLAASQQSGCLQQALKRRYLLVLDWLYLQSLQQINQDLRQVYLNRVSIFKQKQNSLDFDYADLIKAENDVNDLNLELVAGENELELTEKAVRLCVPDADPHNFNAAEIIGINTIEAKLSSWINFTPEQNLEIINQRHEMEAAAAKYKLRLAESRRYINFLQVTYDSEAQKEHDLKEEIFCEISIKLPGVEGERLELNRDYLSYLTEKNRYDDLTRLKTEIWNIRVNQLRNLTRQYQAFSQELQNNSLNFRFKNYSHWDSLDPIVILNAKEYIVKKRIQQEKLWREIFYGYVEILDLSGRLSERPLKNYFSAQEEPLAL